MRVEIQRRAENYSDFRTRFFGDEKMSLRRLMCSILTRVTNQDIIMYI